MVLLYPFLMTFEKVSGPPFQPLLFISIVPTELFNPSIEFFIQVLFFMLNISSELYK